ncbi:hypothetical protein DKM44_03510 [Deinococcus irradiatisoli]|uniref:Uncharacterized protein n=1 Tax=Deinococcus irradiatisoli TaxID=2202254 RepID=A0A2Z3JBR5_9DEIO|nr:hypothetical protein [Deinococcus irradiatisoli]AWN22415.1 hypothetical protein DKM44_03510 [Deinococcus irradiatisoli]
MNWREMLATLRTHLPNERGEWGVRGSLRWLEEAMRARGAASASVRNIIYRDVGTSADKRALYAILSELYVQAGLSAPPLTLPASLPADLELLGRSKKRVFRSFMNALRAGRTPRLLVSGKAGVGKTLLIEHLERAIAEQESSLPVTRLLLGEEWSAALGASGLRSSLPFAVQAEQQAQAAQRFLAGCLKAGRGALLIRAASGHFAGLPPRQADGTPLSPAAWAADHLLRRAPAGLAVLLALEDERGLSEEDQAQLIRLTPPTPGEARRYLMSKLAVSEPQAEALVKQTGRHLDRLALLASVGSGAPLAAARLLGHPGAAGVLAALQVALGGAPSAPRFIVEAALGHSLEDLPPHLRALIDEVNPAEPRPVSWALLQDAAQPDPALLRQARQNLAERTRSRPEWAAWHLRALSELGEWSALTGWLSRHPAQALQAAAVWRRVREQAPPEIQASVARWVVTHHAQLGRYDHPQARDALFSLLEAQDAGARLWGRIKLAESSVDAGNFEAAAAQLAQPEVHLELGREPAWSPDSWHTAAQADALLIEAALLRWQGDFAAASARAQDPRTDVGGARAHLWRGLIAKDAGQWSGALRHLAEVPPTSPLLYARARAQEGDLRLRLGQVAAAYAALDGAAERLNLEGAAPEERARVEARCATALRRLGQLPSALARSREAQLLAQDADPVLRSRIASESIPLLLALEDWPQARAAAVQALALLTEPGLRRAEATYRLRRTHYRTALLYLARGLGTPYLHPLRGSEYDHADLQRARALLDRLLGAPPGPADREQVLTFDMLLSRALCEPDPLQALAFAERALAMTDHPYAEAQARASQAEALLRGQQPAPALGEINRAHALLRRVSSSGPSGADPGLQAQLIALEVQVQLHSGPTAAALGWVEDALGEAHLQPFRAGVWREVGRVLETLEGGPELALSLWPQLDLTWWRLPDALPIVHQGG